MRNTHAAPSVIACENPADLSDGIHILFGDGRIEFCEVRWAHEVLAPYLPPSVASAEFQYDAPRQTIAFRFTESVSATLQTTDLVLTNLTTGKTVPTNKLALTYDYATESATFVYTGNNRGILPDGDYRATLAAGTASDSTGKPLSDDFTFEFFVLAGDANRDRTVNAADLRIVFRNFAKPGRVFSQGDFNYDGRTNLADLLILIGNWRR